MEIDEVVARLTKRYWPVLVLAIVLPMVLVAVLVSRQAPRYTAQARVAVSAEIPKSAAESAGLLSQVDALATSRDLVQRALASAHITGRDPATMAQHDVTVSGNGTSAVMTIGVTDRDPVVAGKTAGALAAEVNTAVNASRIGNLPSVIAGVDRQLGELARRRAPIAAAISASQQSRTPNANLPLLQSELAGVDTLIADLSSDRNRLSEELAAAGNAAVVATAQVPTAPDPSGLGQKLALAAVLGLAVGLLIAALAETVRPTVSGAARLGRLLTAPLLGRLDANPAVLLSLGRRIRLAARRAGVRQVVVTSATGKPVPDWVIDRLGSVVLPPLPGLHPAPVEDPVRIGALAGLGPLPAQNGNGAHPAEPGQPGPVLRVGTMDELDPADEAAPIGVLVLAGGSTNAAAVHGIRDLLAASGWPLLGVVAHPRFGRRP
ncbi:MAG TPA: hypothetical protein VMB79_13295 [Jatrophihabitans sp.]|nr:hypothetical protein [Jatrophihabitans sp.]